MVEALVSRATRDTKTVVPVTPEAWSDGRPALSASARKWAQANGFAGKPGSFCRLPDEAGGVDRILVGVDPNRPIWSFGGLPAALGAGTYAIEGDLAPQAAGQAALGWALGAYRFDRYRAQSGPGVGRLVWPKGADRRRIGAAVEATALVRDLVNTPAGDMGPPELASAARALARRHQATCRVSAGDALRKQGFHAIHAIGRAAAKAPRLIDLRWGAARSPKLTLVGKGVCFDTGGLDIKSAGGMKLMKKDMGGAAHVLGLAHMIMAARLKVRLRVLIPAVENAIDGGAVYPLDIVKARDGRTIEIGHTDAEGRVVLADALVEASRDKPDLIVDFATLTGAARIALGTEIPALFTNDDELAGALAKFGCAEGDPVWRLPLWSGYAYKNESDLADITNNPKDSYGGAISAALFLQSFVAQGIPWAHYDVMAWNLRDRPDRPIGGEAMAVRATFRAIEARFGGGRA